MKIRTDFVTNSSSSSFVSVVIETKDGEKYDLSNDDEGMFMPEFMPDIQDDKLMFSIWDYEEGKVNVEIKSVKDLAAVLYMNGFEVTSKTTFKILRDVFSLLCKKTSPRKFIEKFSEIEGFEELEDIDPDDYDDKAELREVIMEIVGQVLSDEYSIYNFEDGIDEQEIEPYLEFIKNVKKLSDIKKVTFLVDEHDYGEFMNQYSECIYDDEEEMPLIAISQDSEEYDEAFEKWCQYLNEVLRVGKLENVEVTPAVYELVENALESGDRMDLVPDSVSTTSKVELDLSVLSE